MVLQSLVSGKASGIDGLLADFYKIFWDGNENDQQILARVPNKGQLTCELQETGVLTLLPKKGTGCRGD